MTRTRRWLGILAGLTTAIVFAEVTLQVMARTVPAVDQIVSSPFGVEPLIPDSVFGRAGNPRRAGHDAAGFRNARASGTANIVTLGDSQTYGNSVESEEAWPSVLASQSGLAVYNMAIGGWGPGEAYLLLDSALARRPEVVVFGFFFGNDLFDVIKLGLRVPAVGAFIPTELRATSSRLEETEPLAASIDFLFAREAIAAANQAGRRSAVRRFISRQSKLYGVLRATRRLVSEDRGAAPANALLGRDMEQALAGATPAQRRFLSVAQDGHWRTLLTVPYRQHVLDDNDPRIRAGFEGTKAILARMDSLSDRRGARFLVVLMPTKESVFASRTGGIPNAALDSLVNTEARLRGELALALDSAGIAYVDVLGPLQQASEQPYFEDADGHFNSAGHRVIAAAVASWIDGNGASP